MTIKKVKTLQIPMDAALQARWDFVASRPENRFLNQAGILDKLMEDHNKLWLVNFDGGCDAAKIKSFAEKLAATPGTARTFKIEEGTFYRNMLDREASKEAAREIFTWTPLFKM